MFSSIFSTTGTQLGISSVLTAYLCALLCGVLIALLYRRLENPSRNFLLAVTLLPGVVMSVILLVNGDLGVGVAVAGSFSLVRFRSLPGKASDIVVIFLAMATGLACGIGQVGFALFLTVVCAASALLLSRLSIYRPDTEERSLRITIPEDLDYTNVFDDIFEQYTSRCRLLSVKTTNMGSLYQLEYSIRLRDAAQEKQMLDALRTRNGNLTVACALGDTKKQEL